MTIYLKYTAIISGAYLHISYLLNRHDSHHMERFLQSLPDALHQHDPRLHVLIPNNPVLLVVLLYLHRDVANKVRDLVDCHLL